MVARLRPGLCLQPGAAAAGAQEALLEWRLDQAVRPFARRSLASWACWEPAWELGQSEERSAMRSDDGAAVSSCRLLQRLLPTTSEEMNGGEGCGQHSCALCSRRLPRLPATIALEKCVEDRVEVSGSRPASHRLAESLPASCPSAADAVRDAYCGCSRAKLAGPPLAVCGSRLGRSAHRGWSTSFLGWRPFLQSSYCIVRGLTEAT